LLALGNLGLFCHVQLRFVTVAGLTQGLQIAFPVLAAIYQRVYMVKLWLHDFAKLNAARRALFILSL
jgi:hypothetical protein